MRASIVVPIIFGTALASSAHAQTVIQRTITQEPVETTVTRTPDGTIVTRRPLDAAAPVETTATRRIVRRSEITRPAPARRMTTHAVSATRPARHIATAPRHVTRRVALTPAERHIVYQTIVERVVEPAPTVVAPPPYGAPAPYLAPQPPLVSAQVALPAAPLVAQDDADEPIYTVGSVLPRNVPLYAVPQDVALRVPAIQRYSYTWLGGRAYLVDPTTGTIVEDVTE
ncbi:MAG: DUF1236 domain-containing protein [Alphaproteobacteria bacterium]|nr:DUF1236 domain-containing protein [Alphaproteobacteria bacterium]